MVILMKFMCLGRGWLMLNELLILAGKKEGGKSKQIRKD